MLDILVLTTRWGQIFGGINETNTFRGVTLVTRADSIATLYDTAAEQRIVVGDLYEKTQTASVSLSPLYDDYVQLVKDTLIQMCKDDTSPPPTFTDLACLHKLITDMVLQGQTFQQPAPTVSGSSTFANATAIATVLGPPKGNGTIVASIIEPRTGMPKIFPLPENIQFVCTQDSYSDGVPSGSETFQSFGSIDRPTNDPLWPGGSGTNDQLTSATSGRSSLVSNAYFDNWDAVSTNTLLDWTTSNLTPGTTIIRSADAYVGAYAVNLTAAVANAELKQTVTGLVGATNYVVGLRVKRVTAVTAGILTIALRDDTGAVIKDASGANLSFTIPLTGAVGGYALTSGCFALQRAFPTTVQASIKVTTGMNPAETVLLDTFELQPMQTLYTGGIDVAFLPGSVGWADGDTYAIGVANNADVKTFVRDIDRVYDVKSIPLDLPVSGSPTVSNGLIS